MAISFIKKGNSEKIIPLYATTNYRALTIPSITGSIYYAYNLDDYWLINIGGDSNPYYIFKKENNKLNLIGNITFSNVTYSDNPGIIGYTDECIYFVQAGDYHRIYEYNILTKTTTRTYSKSLSSRLNNMDILWSKNGYYALGGGSLNTVYKYDFAEETVTSVTGLGLSGSSDEGIYNLCKDNLIFYDKKNNKLSKISINYDNSAGSAIVSDTYTDNIIGVNYYGNKIFTSTGIYTLSDNLMIGEKLNDIPTELKNINNVMFCYNNKYYGIYNGNLSSFGSIPIDLYEFNEELNTLNKIESISAYQGTTNFKRVVPLLYTKSNVYDFITEDTIIGYNINGQNVYLNQSRNITTDKILSGYTSYAQDGSPISGTMTNNGELNITPSTQEQTIPEGYTSGGTINAVDNTIDSNIQATNIKKDIVILGVTGTYEQKPNIFTQETEPQTKNGIWVKANKTFANKVAVQRALSETGEYLKMTNIPYDFNDGSPAVVGTDIYLLGASLSGYRQYNYKYNTLTDTYTQMTNIPYEFYDGSAVAVGTDIYLLGGSISKTTNYKYDTLTDTYTQMTNIPYEFYNGSAVAIGTDIYLWGDNVQYNYKYNTLTDTYTKMSNMPFRIYHNKIVAVGTNIYALGVGGSYIDNYKYNTLTDTFTKMTDIPYNFRVTPAVAIGTDIYLLGSASHQTNNYRYDTLTDTYEKMTDIPYDIYGGSAVLVGTNIYLLSSMEDEYSTNNYKYTLTLNTDIQNNSLVLEQGGMLYKTILFDSAFTNGIEYKFTSVWLKNEDGTLDNTTPIYYGNGTEWIQFKGATN